MEKLDDSLEKELPIKYIILDNISVVRSPSTYCPMKNAIGTSFTDRLRENRQRELKRQSDQFAAAKMHFNPGIWDTYWIVKSNLDHDVRIVTDMLFDESFLNNYILLKLDIYEHSSLNLLRSIDSKRRDIFSCSDCNFSIRGNIFFIKKWTKFLEEIFNKLVTALSEKTGLEIRKEKTTDKEGICLELLEDEKYGIRFWW